MIHYTARRDGPQERAVPAAEKSGRPQAAAFQKIPSVRQIQVQRLGQRGAGDIGDTGLLHAGAVDLLRGAVAAHRGDGAAGHGGHQRLRGQGGRLHHVIAIGDHGALLRVPADAHAQGLRHRPDGQPRMIRETRRIADDSGAVLRLGYYEGYYGSELSEGQRNFLRNIPLWIYR